MQIHDLKLNQQYYHAVKMVIKPLRCIRLIEIFRQGSSSFQNCR